MTIYINGVSISKFGLTLLKGSLDNLIKPWEYKSLVLNENATMDGARALLENRKVKSRDVVLNFLLKSETQATLIQEITNLVKTLAEHGEIELDVKELRQTYRLVYLSCDKYSGFSTNSCTLSIKFKELNPKNRQ